MKYKAKEYTILVSNGKEINLSLLSQARLAELHPKYPHLITVNDNTKRKPSESNGATLIEGDAPSAK